MKVGDRVICIKAHSQSNCPLIVGREYIVYGIQNCCHLVIDVGIISGYPVRCLKCGDKTIDSVWWLSAMLFRKVEEKREVNYVKLEIEIEEPILN